MRYDSSSPVLVVDLDGTLIRSDILYETLWSGVSRDWTIPFRAAQSLSIGRAALKAMLVRRSRVDVTTLPYNDTVLATVRAWRDAGGATALVTASDQALANEIGAHLDLFDEVHGSTVDHNLKGSNKAAFLSEHFSNTGFHYIGDHKVDLPVWKKAKKAFTVNASPRLRHAVEEVSADFEHLVDRPPAARHYFQALRSHQWVKNVLIFLPMMAAHETATATLLQSMLAFVAFCMVASSVYVMNDLLDLSADRVHSHKKKRPFAAGNVPIADGTWLMIGLLAGGLLCSAFLGLSFFLVLMLYFGLTTLYSLSLKRKLIVDICTLAALYTMRIIAGGAATGIPLTVWLLAFSMFLFFALAAVKRQAELIENIAQGKVGAAGRGYHVDDLSIIQNMAISSGFVSVLVLVLYVNSDDVNALYSAPYFLWGIALVLLYWVARMVMMAHRGRMHHDPIVYAVKDKVSRSCILIILGLLLAASVL
ncbi:UbiA family prenyltransferase [Vannielia sp. SX4]|uniref:UbiA family prenyltransferase n=1 Tax=Vannielia sp. SX4 TaxID=3463852 RepID=UPI00405807FB